MTESTPKEPTQDATAKPRPAPMSPELLESRSEFLLKMIREQGITKMTVALAQAISDKDLGGNSQNVDKLVPQIGDGGPTNISGYNARLNVNGKPNIQEDELNAAFLAAAVEAAKVPGMKMENVDPEQIFKLVPEYYKKIQSEELKCACL